MPLPADSPDVEPGEVPSPDSPDEAPDGTDVETERDRGQRRPDTETE